jgi:hypothetical protein
LLRSCDCGGGTATIAAVNLTHFVFVDDGVSPHRYVAADAPQLVCIDGVVHRRVVPAAAVASTSPWGSGRHSWHVLVLGDSLFRQVFQILRVLSDAARDHVAASSGAASTRPVVAMRSNEAQKAMVRDAREGCREFLPWEGTSDDVARFDHSYLCHGNERVCVAGAADAPSFRVSYAWKHGILEDVELTRLEQFRLASQRGRHGVSRDGDPSDDCDAGTDCSEPPYAWIGDVVRRHTRQHAGAECDAGGGDVETGADAPQPQSSKIGSCGADSDASGPGDGVHLEVPDAIVMQAAPLHGASATVRIEYSRVLVTHVRL